MTGARWIDLLDPSRDELERAIPQTLHARALNQLLAPFSPGTEPRPTLEAHDDYVFGVFLVAVMVPTEDRVYYQEVDVVLTHELVVTVRKTPPDGPPFDAAPLREAEAIGPLAAGMFLYELVDEVAERYFALVDVLDDEIDELEESVESMRAEIVRDRVSRLRHDLLHVRRTLTPTRDAIRRVLDGRIESGKKRYFPREIELHFADAHDKLLRATEGLDLVRELLAGVRDYHQAKVASDQNEVMKRLTAIASILFVPTFIVGLYGQNFRHIPELNWGFGYWWAWGWILLTTVGQIIFFRRKRWL
jgi:magnesium transporter